LSPQTHAPLPKQVVDLFADLQFFEIGFKNADTATYAILKRIADGNRIASGYLLNECLERIYNNASTRQYSIVASDTFVTILRILMGFEDGLFGERVATLITGVCGFATVLYEDGQNQQRPTTMQGYTGYQHSFTTVRETYLDLGTQFYCSYPIARWVDTCATRDPAVNYFRGCVNPTDRIVPSKAEIDGYKRVRVTVTGATDSSINGEYEYAPSTSRNGHCFQKIHYDPRVGRQVRYTVYRWYMNTGPYRWFISLSPGAEHGDRDKDFYSAPSTYKISAATDDHYPPRSGWREAASNTMSTVRVTWELIDEGSMGTRMASDPSDTDSSYLLDDSMDSSLANLAAGGMLSESVDSRASSESNHTTPSGHDGSDSSDGEELHENITRPNMQIFQQVPGPRAQRQQQNKSGDTLPQTMREVG
jgi:hypothetical protein